MLDALNVRPALEAMIKDNVSPNSAPGASVQANSELNASILTSPSSQYMTCARSGIGQMSKPNLWRPSQESTKGGPV